MTDLPDNQQKIQTEATQFRGPVSESLAQNLGGSINFLMKHIFGVGDIASSMQTEAAFQTLHSTDWILADGRAVPGSTYASTIGASVPDLRGVVLRGKDNARGLDPHGEQALGTYQADQFNAHNHAVTDPQHFHAGLELNDPSHATVTQDFYTDGVTTSPGETLAHAGGGGTFTKIRTEDASSLITINNNGGSETNAKAVVINHFIRIN